MRKQMSETALWRAVIDRAKNDACDQIGDGTTKDRVRWRATARSWFQNAGRDFHRVCDLAGLHPDWVRAKALQDINTSEALQALQDITKSEGQVTV